MSNSSAYNFGFYIIPVSFLVFVIWAVCFLVGELQKEKEKKIAIENEKRRLEAQENYLYNKICREENVPETAVKVFLYEFFDEQRRMVDIPAFLWKENDCYRLLPLTQGLIKLRLDPQKTENIIVSRNQSGAYSRIDFCIAKKSIPFNKEFEKVLPKQANDYGVKRRPDTGQYYFGGHRITPKSALVLTSTYKLTCKSDSTMYDPSSDFEIKKIMYSDDLITEVQYTEYKSSYLKQVATAIPDKFKRQECLLDLMRKNLISRDDMMRWSETD